MRALVFISSILLSNIVFGQLSNKPPYYDKDSVYISGTVKDEFGKPVENAMVLLHPFYTKKFDVTWIEKDTFYTNKNGQFSIGLNGGQFSNNLYFKKEGFFISEIFLAKAPNKIMLNKPVILHNRRLHFFDTKKIDVSDIGSTVKQLLAKYKINIARTGLSRYTTGIRFETADSSMVLLRVGDENTSSNKANILNKKVIGIGVAFTNGKTTIIGKGLEGKERKVYNEYYLEKENLPEE